MKTIIKITKQEAIEAWKKQNPKTKYNTVEIEEISLNAIVGSDQIFGLTQSLDFPTPLLCLKTK